MGKTITLDDKLLATLEREAERTGMSVEEVLHATVRRGLAKPFVVHARSLGKPRIDLECTSAALSALDELERQ